MPDDYDILPNGLRRPILGRPNWGTNANYDLDLLDVLLGQTKPPSYTIATLPAAGTPGRIARVSDGTRGLWMDTGTQWISLSGNVVNVKEFGAKGDNVADDTGAIQSALSAGNAFLPPGTYKVTAAIAVPANRVLFGVGDTSVLSVPTANVIDCLTLASGCQLRSFKITGGGAKATEKKAISGTSVSDVLVDSVTIDAYHGEGIGLVSPIRPIVSNCRITNITRTATSGTGIHMTYTGTSDVVAPLVESCYVASCGGCGIQLDAEWNRSDWRTAGVKVREARVVSCQTDSNAYAGIFLNSAFDSTIVNCTARGNTDYGIGFEFCHSSEIVGCAARANSTFGICIFQGGQSCVISGCTARANTLDGFHIQWGGVVAGDTNTADCLISNCAAQGNLRDGFQIAAAHRTVLSSNTATGNSVHGFRAEGVDTLIRDCVAKSNVTDGIFTSGADRVSIVGCNTSSNVNGIKFNPSGGDQSLDCCVLDCVTQANSADGIVFNGDTVGLSIRGNIVSGNTGYGIYGIARKTHVFGNTIKANGNNGLHFIQPFDCDVSGNTFYGVAAKKAISLPGSGGFAGGRCMVTGNHIVGANSTDTGIEISAGDNTAAGDDMYVLDNVVLACATAYSFINIGGASRLIVRLHRAGTPEGAINAAIGSQVSRLDGGAGTSHYFKESGANTNTGWIGK